MDFFNRTNEMSRLESGLLFKKRLVVIIGRRRVGKTRLLQQWARQKPGRVYVQAIESTTEVQVRQLWQDLMPWLDTTLSPQNAEELLELLSLKFRGECLILDEFPYLVSEDESLPSRIQRRLDAGFNFQLILSGSSQTMMEQEFLNDQSPLYQRADDLFFLQAMEYEDFCEALGFKQDMLSFEYYSLVGGIPKYWEWLSMIPGLSLESAAHELFFAPSAPMNFEPTRLMQDEKVNSVRMKAVLDCIGLGDVRPSQIASRMGVKQGSLSVPLMLLSKSGFIERLIPAGHPSKNPKIVQYRLADPSLRFWFETYLVHSSRWFTYSSPQKLDLIRAHASREFEVFVVKRCKATRFWNSECEVDGVVFGEAKALTLIEVKWTKLSADKMTKIVQDYQEIARKFFADFAPITLEIYDSSYLATKAPIFSEPLNISP